MCVVALVAGGVLSLDAVVSHALPQGRAWVTARAVLDSPSMRVTQAQLGFTADSLVLLTAMATEAGPMWSVLAWGDSSWRVGGMSAIASHAGLAPLATHASRTVSAFVTHNPGAPADSPLLVADVHPGGLGRPDTALRTTSQGTGFAIALSATRRWVVRIQQKTPRVPRFIVRTATSDAAERWHELPARGEDEAGCAVAALDDARALIVTTGESGLRWAVAHGATAAWVDSGAIDPRPRQARNPRLVRDSSGVWLVWTENAGARAARFDGEQWSPPESLGCAHAEGEAYWSSWTAMSTDGGRPALAWGDRGVGATHRDVLCVATPTHSAWPGAEEVPGSEGAAVPTLARDVNGDVWVAWDAEDGSGLRFAHSYVAVRCSPPALRPAGAGAMVSWSLDAPAPGSRWTVLRSVDGTTFDAVGTLVAGPGTHLDWIDTALPAGHPIAYRIRRESLDARFVWASPAIQLKRPH